MVSLTVSVTEAVSPDGMRYFNVAHPACEARVYEQGAHVTHFQARHQAPMLWVSEAEDYQPGKAIRGGIPLCWPWFGAHPKGQGGAHGVARTRPWQLIACDESDTGVTLVFRFLCGPEAGIEQPLSATLTLFFGAQLHMQLESKNLGSAAVDLSLAIHSYFPVGDIHATRLLGAANRRYDDMLTGQQQCLAPAPDITIAGETDRIYYGSAPWRIVSPALMLNIEPEGSDSTVVWNPWTEKSRRLSNFRDDDYLGMLCVETALCGRDSRRLAPGEALITAVEYRYSR